MITCRAGAAPSRARWCACAPLHHDYRDEWRVPHSGFGASWRPPGRAGWLGAGPDGGLWPDRWAPGPRAADIPAARRCLPGGVTADHNTKDAPAILVLLALTRLAVVELIPLDDGRFEERPPPAVLTSQHTTVLDVPERSGTGPAEQLMRSGKSMSRSAPSKRPRLSANQPGPAASTPRHGWSRDTTDEPALGHLGNRWFIRPACGDGQTRPVAACERVGGQAMCDHAEQHGQGDH